MQIKSLNCNKCGAKARVHGSREMGPQSRTAYAQCENPMCSASFKLYIEIAQVVSPTSDLFEPSSKPAHIPLDSPDVAIDMAHEFVARKNNSWSRDETVAHCADYLCKHLDVIGYKNATLMAARALADQESCHLNNWRIDIDLSTSTALIVNRHPNEEERLSGRGHEQYVVSLRELVEFIEARDEEEKRNFLL